MNLIARIALVAMVLFGLWGAGKLSFEQYQTGEACPVLGNFIPACYIAFGGYILIAIGAALSFVPVSTDPVSAVSTAQTWGRYLFWGGTAVAGGLAAIATVMELVKGDVCPAGPAGIPMCYISLAFSAVIAVLYILSFRSGT